MTSKEYGYKFTDPLIRGFFGEGDMGQLSALALFFSLAWMNGRDAGYPIGGSQAVIQGIVHKLHRLGGRLRFGAKVERILVEDNAAVGVRLMDGETITADWVISAADGHATIHDLLGGKYTDKDTKKIYTEFETFPSYLQVSLGVALDLSQQPAFATRLLRHAAPGGPGYTASTGLVPFLSFRSNLLPSRQDGRYLLPTNAEF